MLHIIVKTLRRNEVFDKVGAQFKTFYLNAVGLLFWAKDFLIFFSLVKTIVKCILTLCKWKFQDEKNENCLQNAKDTLFFWFDDLNMAIEDDEFEDQENYKELNKYFFKKFVPYLRDIIYT